MRRHSASIARSCCNRLFGNAASPQVKYREPIDPGGSQWQVQSPPRSDTHSRSWERSKIGHPSNYMQHSSTTRRDIGELNPSSGTSQPNNISQRKLPSDLPRKYAGKWDTPSRAPSSERQAAPSDFSSTQRRTGPVSRGYDPSPYRDAEAKRWQPRDTGKRKTERPNARPASTNNQKSVFNKARPKQPRLYARRKDVFLPTTITVATLAKLLNVKLAKLLDKMWRIGMTEEANYDYILTADYAALLAEEYGFNPIIDDEAAFDIHPPVPSLDQTSLPSRPPIVTIMGHVDHGKTTLLDTLRSASVAKGEAGGITQHIGAFSVPVTGHTGGESGPQTITFLDTPGHAAFSAMRARGAHVTDIVVLVVAADDGIMPQTKEVINLLKKDGSDVDLVVAINKIDKAGADPDSIKKALMVEGVQLEEFGGDIPAVHVSGLTGEGLPELVETLSAVAEVRDLRASQDGPVYGHILESNVHRGLGSVATVLIRSGSLKIGSHIISGTTQSKVRQMFNSSGESVQSAIPGMAVTVAGWKALPKAGDEVLEGSEADIKKALANRIKKADADSMQGDAQAINRSRMHERGTKDEPNSPTPAIPSGPQELRLVIKADVSGSSEALESALQGIGNGIVVSKVVSTGVGNITESDVMLAKAANATIIGFSVSAARPIQALATQNSVPIVTGNIIYKLMDDVRGRVIDMLPKIVETKVTGEANVLQIFEVTGKNKDVIKVAGCRVSNGMLERNKFIRVIRMGHVIHEGTLDTLRQVKKDITEARKGMDCGVSLTDFRDLQEGDRLQMFEKIEKPGII